MKSWSTSYSTSKRSSARWPTSRRRNALIAPVTGATQRRHWPESCAMQRDAVSGDPSLTLLQIIINMHPLAWVTWVLCHQSTLLTTKYHICKTSNIKTNSTIQESSITCRICLDTTQSDTSICRWRQCIRLPETKTELLMVLREQQAWVTTASSIYYHIAASTIIPVGVYAHRISTSDW